MVKFVGFFAETVRNESLSNGKSIFDSVCNEAAFDTELVTSYLRRGHVLWETQSDALDVIGGVAHILNSDDLLTDGEWVWPWSLQYYFSRYNLRLPDDFLVRIRSLSYRVPRISDEERSRIGSLAISPPAQ